MLSIISFICAAIGYVLFLFTEMITFPIILIAAGFLLALVDLVSLYQKEKLLFSDFVKEAFQARWGSTIGFLAGICFIGLLIIV